MKAANKQLESERLKKKGKKSENIINTGIVSPARVPMKRESRREENMKNIIQENKLELKEGVFLRLT